MKRSDVDLYCRDGVSVAGDTMLFSTTLKIVGDYNVCNAMIAACMAYRMGGITISGGSCFLYFGGAPPGVYRGSKRCSFLQRFQGDQHMRLRLPALCVNIILLAGGHDKGDSLR